MPSARNGRFDRVVDPRLRRRQQEGHEPGGEHDAGEAAQQAERDALDEHLPDEPAPACAERHPQRHLPGSSRRACEQQAGHVGRGDEQHEADEGGDEGQRGGQLTALLDQPLGAGRHDERRNLDPALGFREGGHVLVEEHGHLRGGALAPDVRLEPPHHLQPPVPGIVQPLAVGGGEPGLERQGDREFRFDAHLQAAVEPGRCDADDHEGHAVERDPGADDRRVAAESTLPAGVADDRDGIRITPVVVRLDRAASHRADAKAREVVAGDELPAGDFGDRVPPGTHDEALDLGEGDGGSQRRLPIPEVGIRGVRKRGGGAPAVLVEVQPAVDGVREQVLVLPGYPPEQNEIVRRGHREGPQQHRVQQAERRDGGAESDCQ